MLHLPQMFLIGSAGRNAGKTEFACSLIKRYSASHKVIGIKITTIKERDGLCPRGGKGCGVCSSLEDDYCITDEASAPPDKDTGRLLAAGAAKVYWLRVMKTHLEQGIKDLLGRIDPDALLVVESNSLRTIVSPGIFLMVRNGDSESFKPSAEAVRHWADKLLVFDGKGYDFPPDIVSVEDRVWVIREKAAAIILTGGKSSRMGEDKAMLPVQGAPMIERLLAKVVPCFEEVIVSAGDPATYAALGRRVVVDRIAGQGPLMGISSAMHESRHDLHLVVAVDMPHPDMRLARRMLALGHDVDAVVPRTGDAFLEPLFAVYNKSALPEIDELIDSGERKVRALFDHCNVKILDLPKGEWTTNLNTPDDYRSYAREKETA